MTKSKKIALCGILAALALGLSLLESLLPLQLLVPLPGVRLGLGNVVILTALYLLGASAALAVLLCRIAVLYLAAGNFTALFMSLCGGLLSLLAMAAAHRAPRLFSIYGVSFLGAAFHNIGQILSARLLLGSWNIIYYLPLLLCAGLVTAPVVAALAGQCLKRLGPHKT